MRKPSTEHRLTLFAVAGSVMMLAAITTTGPRLGAQQSAPHVRTIPEVTRPPIVDRLLPDDEVVVITAVEENGLLPEHELTPAEIIDEAAGTSDLIATVDVEQVTGLLTGDGTWINTRVVGIVQQVLSSKTLPIRRGQRIEAQYNGGETKIGKVVVRAGKAGEIQPRRRYLLFLEVGAASTRVFGPTREPFLIQNGTLVRPWSLESTETPDLLEGMKLNEVAKQLRRLSK